jgi:hypothetical protein
MGIERFPLSKKRLKKAIVKKTAGFNVQLTPVGTRTHVRSANLDPDCLAFTVPKTTHAYVFVEREDLEERIQTSDTESSITISEETAIRAIEMIDAEIAGDKRLISRWRTKLATGFAGVRIRLKRISRNPPKSNEVKKLEAEIRRLKDQANKEAGTVIEMQIAGLIPMGEKPPIPLKHVVQMHYGCDWLSMAWKGPQLHLFWIESNLTRTPSLPPLTRNEQRLRNASQNDLIFNHHCHHWVDMEGNIHWDL